MSKAEALVQAISELDRHIEAVREADLGATTTAERDRRALINALACLPDDPTVDELDQLLGNMPKDPDEEDELPVIP